MIHMSIQINISVLTNRQISTSPRQSANIPATWFIARRKKQKNRCPHIRNTPANSFCHQIYCTVARSKLDTPRTCILTWVSSFSSPSQNLLSQWHSEENSSYTATALYGNLTRFHKHLAYIALNVNNILFTFVETDRFSISNTCLIIQIQQIFVKAIFPAVLTRLWHLKLSGLFSQWIRNTRFSLYHINTFKNVFIQPQPYTFF